MAWAELMQRLGYTRYVGHCGFSAHEIPQVFAILPVVRLLTTARPNLPHTQISRFGRLFDHTTITVTTVRRAIPTQAPPIAGAQTQPNRLLADRKMATPGRSSGLRRNPALELIDEAAIGACFDDS
jgi:hypothetical protein